MLDSLHMNSSIQKYPELPYVIVAMVFYIISVFFGLTAIGDTIELYGIHFHVISTTLWITCGLISFYCLYTAFFDMWIYALHLIFAYFLTGLGILLLYLFFDTISVVIAGGIMTALGLFFILLFIVNIGKIKNYRIMSSTDQEQAREQYSLGEYWYFTPFIFFALILLSFMDLGFWYENSDHMPVVHLLSEIGIIIIAIYILWIPENVLFYGIKDEPLEGQTEGVSPGKRGENGLPSGGHSQDTSESDHDAQVEHRKIPSLPGIMKKRSDKLENCPGFDHPPILQKKSCPNCHHVIPMYWCTESEEYLVECQECGKKTYHGRKVCVHCKSSMGEKVHCDSCGRKYPIRRLKAIE